MKRFVRSFMVFCAASALALAASPPADAAGQGTACYRAHVSGLGWGDWFCGPDYYVGTVGQGRAIEALQISLGGVGRYCARAHLRNYGWQDEVCDDGTTATHYITVGTTGQNRPIEALEISTKYEMVHGRAHVQNIGWMDEAWGSTIRLGTEGRGLSMEAVALWFE